MTLKREASGECHQILTKIDWSLDNWLGFG